jgi:hypothetical protein
LTEDFTTLALAIAAATGLLSIPTDGIPFSRAARFVVPLPQNGSYTHLFCFDSLANTRNGKSSGYIVKYGQIELSG